MIKKWLKQRNKAIRWGLILGVVVAFLPVLVFGVSLDNFEDKNDGNITGQGNWLGKAGDAVVSDFRYTGIKSLKGKYGALSEAFWSYYVFSEPLASGGIKFWNYRTTGYAGYTCTVDNQFRVQKSDGKVLGYFLDSATADNCDIKICYGDGDYTGIDICENLNAMIFDEWYSTSITWRFTAPATFEVNFALNDEWTGWKPARYGVVVDWFYFQHNQKSQMWIDDLETDEAEPPPLELRVWIDIPASGSTATSTNTNFTIEWEDWDFGWIYKDFVFSFYEKNTGILTGTKFYTPTTESGSHVLKFSDFGISKNGKYYFHAKARSYLYDYVAYYTGDLVSPEWWINIEVEGWQPIFEMPDFDTWYSENSKFATPTAIFTGITTFISPIFSKIGEFGDSVVAFLNLDEAYDRGYDLGKIIPLFRHYVSEIEVFFGGFPIIQIFLAFLIILLGIFIIRLILKFIPGLG